MIVYTSSAASSAAPQAAAASSAAPKRLEWWKVYNRPCGCGQPVWIQESNPAAIQWAERNEYKLIGRFQA